MKDLDQRNYGTSSDMLNELEEFTQKVSSEEDSTPELEASKTYLMTLLDKM